MNRIRYEVADALLRTAWQYNIDILSELVFIKTNYEKGTLGHEFGMAACDIRAAYADCVFELGVAIAGLKRESQYREMD